jgi:hypothetical protein
MPTAHSRGREPLGDVVATSGTSFGLQRELQELEAELSRAKELLSSSRATTCALTSGTAASSPAAGLRAADGDTDRATRPLCAPDTPGSMRNNPLWESMAVLGSSPSTSPPKRSSPAATKVSGGSHFAKQQLPVPEGWTASLDWSPEKKTPHWPFEGKTLHGVASPASSTRSSASSRRSPCWMLGTTCQPAETCMWPEPDAGAAGSAASTSFSGDTVVPATPGFGSSPHQHDLLAEPGELPSVTSPTMDANAEVDYGIGRCCEGHEAWHGSAPASVASLRQRFSRPEYISPEAADGREQRSMPNDGLAAPSPAPCPSASDGHPSGRRGEVRSAPIQASQPLFAANHYKPVNLHPH